MSITEQPRALPPLVVEPTEIQLFRFSAVTWNPHRVHFDDRHSTSEGHDGVLVHSHLRAAFALRCLTEGLGHLARIDEFSYRVVRPAVVRHRLEYRAELIDGQDLTSRWRIWEEQRDGGVGLQGSAVVTMMKES